MSEQVVDPAPEKVPDIWGEKNPQIILISQKYERSGYATEWDNNRVSRLAQALNKTIWVLCAEAGAFVHQYSEQQDRVKLIFDKRGVLRAWKTNIWPVAWVMNFERLELALKLRDHKKFMLSPTDVVGCRIISGSL